MALQFDALETTAQRLEKYLKEHYGYGVPAFERYELIGQEIGRSRNAVKYAAEKLKEAGKLVFGGKKMMLVQKENAV